MAKDKFMQEMFGKNKGLLHEKLHVAKDKKIPAKKLEKASHSKSPTLRKEVNSAMIGRKFGGGKKK